MIFFAFAASSDAKIKSTKDIKDLNVALKAGVPVVLKLGADWCPPCRKMKPILAALSVEQDGKIIFLAHDIDAYKDIVNSFKIRLIPAIIFYNKYGKPVKMLEGFMPREELLKKVDELKLNK